MNQTVIGIGIINHADALFLPDAVGDLEDVVDDVQIFLIKTGQFLLLFGVLEEFCIIFVIDCVDLRAVTVIYNCIFHCDTSIGNT